MARFHKLDWQFERFPNGDDEEPIYIDAVVHYRYSPGCPARINCEPDYGWDAQPAEVEIEEIVGLDGKAVIVGEDEGQAIEEAIFCDPPDLGPDPDYAYDRMRDERWEFV